jgi:hypothetical protein
MGLDSSSVIATRYGLDGPGIESHWVQIFRTRPDQLWGPPSFLPFPVVKRPGRGVDHPTPSSAEIKERVELYLYSPPWAAMACSRVTFIFTFSTNKRKKDKTKRPQFFVGVKFRHLQQM